MTFEVRLLVVTLAAFAAISLVSSVVVLRLARRTTSRAPQERAARLLRLRLYPVGLATVASALAAASFLAYEQRDYLESTGLVMRGMAILCIAMWLSAMERLVRLAVATRRAHRWLATARPIQLDGATVEACAVASSFPVVAIVGIFRPKLVIAESVLAACSDEELRAIVAHENRHVRTRDNLRRAIMAVAPDVLAWLPIARQLRNEWNDAIEEAADDAAASSTSDGRLVLAEALLRVARLGTSRPTVIDLPASALFRGESVDRRVRRLLAPAPPAAPRRHDWRRSLAAAAMLLAAAGSLDLVHHLVEFGVRFLP